MYKQIFNKSDGTPLLIESIPNLDTGEDDFEYNEDEYTEEAPPCELYEPIRFENGEWQGATKEEWESNNNNVTPLSDLELLKKTVQLLTLQMNNVRKENVELSSKLTALESKGATIDD